MTETDQNNLLIDFSQPAVMELDLPAEAVAFESAGDFSRFVVKTGAASFELPETHRDPDDISFSIRTENSKNFIPFTC